MSKALIRADLCTKLTYLLISLTIVKLLLVAFSSPLMGYGNNSDFFRQSSCVGIWQLNADETRIPISLDGPINSLVFNNQQDKGNCIESVDNIFPTIAIMFHQIGDKVDFREISFWKISFLILMLVFLIINTQSKINKLAISLVFLLVFGDLVNLLYVNTLYYEFSVIFSIFFAVFWTINLFNLNSNKYISIFFAAISIIWLGFSKQQYMPLAVALGIICSVIFLLRHKEKFSAVFFLSLSLVIPALYSHLNDEGAGFMRIINYANKTDTFLWSVLPEASNKEVALTKLGLPSECIKGIGKSWYTQSSNEHPCPEVENLSRVKLIELFLADPTTFINPMYKASIGIHPFYLTYLGYLEDKKDANSLAYMIHRKTSLSYVMAKIPKQYLPAFVMISAIISVIALVVLLMPIVNKPSLQPFLLMIFLGGMVIIYSISSSVFGDGYGDLQKHAVGFLEGVAFQVVGAICIACHYINRSNV